MPFPLRKQTSLWTFHRGDIDLNAMGDLNRTTGMNGLNMNDMGGINMNDMGGQMGDNGPLWGAGQSVWSTGGSSTVLTSPSPVPSSASPYWFDPIISLVSQGISAFGGAHSGTQVVASGDRVGAITNPQPSAYGVQPGTAIPPGYTVVNGQLVPISGAVPGGIGISTPGSGIDGILSWATQPQNLTVIAIAAVAYFLFTRDPNKRR